jgi:hypothetical protein
VRGRNCARSAIGVFLIAALLFAASCDQGKLKRLAQAANGFALTVRSFQQAEIAAYNQQLVSQDEHVAIQRALLDVANAGIELDSAIRLAQSKPKASGALQAALASLDRLVSEGVLHVKNPKVRHDLETLLLSAKGFLTTISAVLE